MDEMKVLVINGSPRAKGNSDLLCDEFIRGAEEAGNQVEKISLREKEIFPCKACYACFRTGSCVQKDDMPGILEKAEKADVLLLATPTYFLTMSGQMKVMIDRLLLNGRGWEVFPGGVFFRTDNTGTLKMVMASVNAVDAITIFSIWRKRTEV